MPSGCCARLAPVGLGASPTNWYQVALEQASCASQLLSHSFLLLLSVLGVPGPVQLSFLDSSKACRMSPRKPPAVPLRSSPLYPGHPGGHTGSQKPFPALFTSSHERPGTSSCFLARNWHDTSLGKDCVALLADTGKPVSGSKHGCGPAPALLTGSGLLWLGMLGPWVRRSCALPQCPHLLLDNLPPQIP